jgi:hypothetical protein
VNGDFTPFTSMGGISGAFLLLPIQMSVLGFTTPSVTSTNFLFNVTGTPAGVYRYALADKNAGPQACCSQISGIAVYLVISIFLT